MVITLSEPTIQINRKKNPEDHYEANTNEAVAHHCLKRRISFLAFIGENYRKGKLFQTIDLNALKRLSSLAD